MNTYRGFTDAQKKANGKYLKEKVDNITIRLPKGDKARIQAAAEAVGESVNGYIKTAIDRRLEGE